MQLDFDLLVWDWDWDFHHHHQGACVQNVLDSVISALLEDKNRKFIYVEIVPFRSIPFLLVWFGLVCYYAMPMCS